MKTLIRLQILTAAVIAAMGLAACDDDDGPTGNGNDNTAPTLASISALDSTHVDARFNEPVDRATAEVEANYSIVRTGAPVPDEILVVGASLKSDGRTVAITTGEAMIDAGYLLVVQGVADTEGNAITETTERTFTGSANPDETPPEIVLRTPSTNQTNVETAEPILIQFSEPVPTAAFNTAFSLLVGGNPVPVTVTTTDQLLFTVTPTAALQTGTMYTVSLSGLEDMSSNVMRDDEWTFRTTTTPASTVTSVR